MNNNVQLTSSQDADHNSKKRRQYLDSLPESRAARPDHQPFDEILIECTEKSPGPNYTCNKITMKTTNRFVSSLDSEWRIRCYIQFYKDNVFFTCDDTSNIDAACRSLQYIFVKDLHLIAPSDTVPASIKFFTKGLLRTEIKAKNLRDALLILDTTHENVILSDASDFKKTLPFCDQEGCNKPWLNTYKIINEYCRTCGVLEHRTQSQIRKFCHEHSNRGDGIKNDKNNNYLFIVGNAQTVSNSFIELDN